MLLVSRIVARATAEATANVSATPSALTSTSATGTALPLTGAMEENAVRFTQFPHMLDLIG